jgi:hypothetical protein
MRAVDIFGLAAATLIGLLTLTLEAWSSQWWVAVILAATIALLALAHIVLGNFWERFKVNAWGPWFLIFGGPVLGLIWLYVISHWPQQIDTPPPPRSAEIQPSLPAREFTDLTPSQLLAFYQGRTPFVADKLIAPYKGLWIESQGTVQNILPDGRPGASVAVLKSGEDTIECRFGAEWEAPISRLEKGKTLQFRGKISTNQNGSQLYLLDCEVVAPTKKSDQSASFAKLAFVWKPATSKEDVVLAVSITAMERAKDIAFVGRYAKAVHYVSSSEWRWGTSIRLKDVANAVPGEVWEQELLRRPRTGTNTVRLFDAIQMNFSEDPLILVRFDVLDSEGATRIQKAFYLRKIGDTLLTDPTHQDDIGYIGGADAT